MDYARNEKEWKVMKQWIENKYDRPIKTLALENDLNYSRLLKIKRQIDKKDNKMAFIDSKIEKYSKKEVKEIENAAEVLVQLAEDDTNIVHETYSFNYEYEQRLKTLELVVSTLTEKDSNIYILEKKIKNLEDIYNYTKLLILLYFLSIYINFSKYLF